MRRQYDERLQTIIQTLDFPPCQVSPKTISGCTCRNLTIWRYQVYLQSVFPIPSVVSSHCKYAKIFQHTTQAQSPKTSGHVLLPVFVSPPVPQLTNHSLTLVLLFVVWFYGTHFYTQKPGLLLEVSFMSHHCICVVCQQLTWDTDVLGKRL